MEADKHIHPSSPGPDIETPLQEQYRIEAEHDLRHGANGAVLVAAIAVTILFVSWLLFYFGLFMRRGYVG